MADASDIKTRVNRGLAWVAGASSMVWALDLVGVLIIYALWIPPEQIGIASLAIPFFPAFDLAVELGLGAAIVQHDDHSEAKLCTVFWLNLILSIVVAGLIAGVVGPVLAWIQNEPMVWPLFAVYAIKLPWLAVFLVPRALMHRELRYKEISVIRVWSNIAEFAAKLGLAAAGFGIWALVLAPMLRALLYGAGMQLRRPWRPKLIFRPREAWGWAKFGLKASGSQMFYHLYTNLDYHVVFFYFGERAAGLYYFAYEMVLKPCQMIGQTLRPIAFATYSRFKNMRDKLVAQFLQFVRLSMVVMQGFIAIVFVCAEDILYAVWGSEAVPAAAAVRILCGVGALRAVSFTLPPLLDGSGRAGLTLAYSTTASVVLPVSFWVCALTLGDSLGFLSVPVAWLVAYPIPFMLVLWFALGVVGVRARTFVRRVGGVPLCCAAAAAAGLGARWLAGDLPVIARLVVAGGTVVVTLLVLLAFLEDISPRSVARALRGDKVDASDETD